MKSLSVLFALAAFFAVSCERHEFDGPDGTRQLHEKHAAAHSEHAAAEHTPAAEHSEKPTHKSAY